MSASIGHRPTLLVLDTNVVSELMRSTPDPAVVRQVAAWTPGTVFTTAITLAEIGYGIARLPAGRRRQLLQQAATEVFAAYAQKVLPFDGAAALDYPSVVTEREGRGAPVSGFAAQIAAICRVRGASLATRNISDFEGLGLTLLDPWADPA